MLHSLLKRQLKKSELSEETLPTIAQWQDFLERINKTYQESDLDRYLLERSLIISSEEMQETFQKLKESETRYALAEQGANDGLWDWDLTSDDVYYSPRWMEILGLSNQDCPKPDKNCWLDRIHPDDKTSVRKELDEHLQGKANHFQNEHRVLHSDGEYRWVLIRGLAVRNEKGKAFRIAGSLTDITERKQAEAKLAFDAIHDDLTGLPNRKSLMKRLSRSLNRMKVSEEYSFVTLFVDLDRFKTVNDSMGHQAGDELLLKIAQKLEKTIRPIDMVARLGGDEFVLIIENAKTRNQIIPVAERILKELKKPIEIEGQEIYVSASIGIVFGNSIYRKAEELVRDADLAMYRAKVKGKARYEVFEPQMHVGAVSLLQLEMDLRRAVEYGEFTLNFQPIISLNSEEVIGFESLIRWNHPTKGLIPPNDFIPLTEDTGLIIPIGHWVLKESCLQMRKWQDKYSSAKGMIISVNLSACQLEKKELTEEIASILAETGLNPLCLKLEITESVIMKNAEQAIITVKALREMGVRVSIDDFGTGYSSLSYLHRFPIDTLKIDRSFISRIGGQDENAEIVQTIISLASNLGLEVVAEGVETTEQLQFLREIKCGYGQGYYYSRPVDCFSVEQMIGEKANRETDIGFCQNTPILQFENTLSM